MSDESVSLNEDSISSLDRPLKFTFDLSMRCFVNNLVLVFLFIEPLKKHLGCGWNTIHRVWHKALNLQIVALQIVKCSESI